MSKTFLRSFFVYFCPSVWLVFKISLYSRAGYDGERTVFQMQLHVEFGPIVKAIDGLGKHKKKHLADLL